MTEPSVVIILVNWNGKQDTLECLHSLAQDSYRNKTVLLVDNGSQDDSVVTIRSAFPEVEVLETGRNLGFTGGNNAGIGRAMEQKPDYLFLLNNDTTVEPNAIGRLIETAESHPTYGLLAPRIHYYDHPDDVWFGGSLLDLRSGMAIHSDPDGVSDRLAETKIHSESGVQTCSHPVSALPWITGCAMLFRADLLERLGGFDERYFLMWEDVDLSLRTLAAGHEIGMAPAAVIYHKVSRSISQLSLLGLYYYVRNNLLFVRMHSGPAYRHAASAIIRRRLQMCLSAIKRRERGAIKMLNVTLWAIKDHSFGRYGIYHGRMTL